MVTVVVENSCQMTILESLLRKAGVEYEVTETDRYGLATNYLIVDGVPLDLKRSLAWIKEVEDNVHQLN